MATYHSLLSAFDRFMRVKTECRLNMIKKYRISQMSFKQIEYLKKFDEREYVTVSQLAEELNLSKPSISEMVNKFIRLDCVKKEQCNHDARVYYLFLTEKGKRIARLEKIANENFVKRVLDCLDEEDIGSLIELFSKVI